MVCHKIVIQSIWSFSECQIPNFSSTMVKESSEISKTKLTFWSILEFEISKFSSTMVNKFLSQNSRRILSIWIISVCQIPTFSSTMVKESSEISKTQLTFWCILECQTSKFLWPWWRYDYGRNVVELSHSEGQISKFSSTMVK